jgi:protocatechuate 3,4-dioxygenase beta subunit
MRGDYPDPFATSPGTACTLTKSMILGPCYANTLEREDISEGAAGVPMRLSFLVVRADGCTPVAEAEVDVWHAGVEGVYSEFGPGTTCNPGTHDVTAQQFCRGMRKTNASGRVDFSSVVPGCYRGRATHMHFTVRVNGEEYVTSQLFFDDALLDEIEREPDYDARGTRDTRNTQDFILPQDGMSQYILGHAKRPDGALHAWKVLVLRSSLDEELPAAGGGGGGPGGGFPSLPDGGFPGLPGVAADGGEMRP